MFDHFSILYMKVLNDIKLYHVVSETVIQMCS